MVSQTLLVWYQKQQQQQLHWWMLLLLKRRQNPHQHLHLKAPSSCNLPTIQHWLWLGHCSQQGWRIVEKGEITRMAGNWGMPCARRAWGSLTCAAWEEMVLQGPNTNLAGRAGPFSGTQRQGKHSRHQLQKGKFQLNIRKKEFTMFFQRWKRLSREFVQFPFLDILKIHLERQTFSARPAFFREWDDQG